MPRLSRVRPFDDPGYRRVKAGSGFRYVDAKGAPVRERDAERIRALVIPPAWEDVWICARADGHIQAVGTDDAGRRQYIYHPDWTSGRDRRKFARALHLAETLPRARGRVTTSLRRSALDRERVLATAFRLLDQAAPRIGSERYLAAHGSRGLTTLQRRDASVEASVVTLSFPGKSGKRQYLEIDDSDLSGVVAKDFRTLRGTILAAEALARIGPVDTPTDRKRAEVLAVRATAEALGNTPAVARGSYIDPRVFSRYRDGETLDLSKSPESAILGLIRPKRRS
jgi:DNA topoisomerase-1